MNVNGRIALMVGGGIAAGTGLGLAFGDQSQQQPGTTIMMGALGGAYATFGALRARTAITTFDRGLNLFGVAAGATAAAAAAM